MKLHVVVSVLLSLLQASKAFVFTPDVTRLSPDSIVYVNTPVGGILGRRSTLSIDGNTKSLTTFKGIPYAEPPIGDLRFEKPVPKAPFTSTFDAMDFGPRCLQVDDGSGAQTSEDCLSLNVYVPSATVPSSPLKSVMVWIHGGAFQNGAGSMYEADRLSANGDVVVVTLNYRLRQLGFLRMNSSYIPGNYGLWDQHLAIKWVHDNIRAFGGDVNKVTIFGESAGSTSVMYQATYPGNKGLFQRVIAESGCTSSSWAQVDETRSRKAAIDFAASLGCNDTDDTMVMQCLRHVPATDISKLFNSMGYNVWDYLFTASFDGDFVTIDQFDMFKTSSATVNSLEWFNSLDLMMGVNRGDGMALLGSWASLIGRNFTDLGSYTLTRQQFENVIIPFYLNGANNYRNVSNTIISATVFAYTNWSNPDDMHSRLLNLANFQTDIDFILPSLKALDARNVSKSFTYMYEFAFRPKKWMLLGLNSLWQDEAMAHHADELPFVFDAVGPKVTPEEQTMANSMRTLWTNFAKSGWVYLTNHTVDIKS